MRKYLLSRAPLTEAIIGVVPIEPGLDPDEVGANAVEGSVAAAAVVVQVKDLRAFANEDEKHTSSSTAGIIENHLRYSLPSMIFCKRIHRFFRAINAKSKI